MATQTEFVGKAFDQVYESFRGAAESTLQMQQELFKQWTGAWSIFPTVQSPWNEQVQKFQKDWTQATGEMTRKYLEAWERQYKTGVESLEGVFKLTQTKDPAEVRQKVLELWQKSFDCLKELAQAQMDNFQAAAEKWAAMAKKGNP
jgi:hypothetical protein